MRSWVAKLFLALSLFLFACGSGNEDVHCVFPEGPDTPSLDIENRPAGIGDNWTVRWGTSTPDTVEPTLHVCHADLTHQSARITTNNRDAVALEWYKGSPSAALRTIDVSFMVP